MVAGGCRYKADGGGPIAIAAMVDGCKGQEAKKVPRYLRRPGPFLNFLVLPAIISNMFSEDNKVGILLDISVVDHAYLSYVGTHHKSH